MMYFTRHAEGHLSRWYRLPSRKPLVIRGARQVGKTQLVRQFCQLEKLNLVEINLEEFRVSEFEKDTFDIDRCINEILALKGRILDDRTLIFLDEIQESDRAYSRLRFFKERRPEIPVIAAGSLLEVRLKENKQKIPVGRIDYLFLGPLVFTEFLAALGKTVLLGELAKIGLNSKNILAESIHDILCSHFMDFLFVGGMPEAVQRFISEKGSYVAAREVHHQILRSYREDVDRYATGKVAGVIHDVLERVGFEVGNKVVYSRFSKDKTIYIKEAIDTLESIFLIQKVYHTGASSLPLQKTESTSIFKTYFLDVGLYNCLLGVGWDAISGLNYDQLISKGDMAEQFVAQHFYLGSYSSFKPRVHYWLREKSKNAEVDFIQCFENEIVPIEVKSGKAGRFKSLLKFMSEKRGKIAIRLDLAYREILHERENHGLGEKSQLDQISFELCSFPLYGTEFIKDWIKAIRK